MATSVGLLGDGEVVVLTRRTHIKMMFLPILGALILIALTVLLILFLPDGLVLGKFIAGLVGGALVLIVLIPPLMQWACTTYTFTDRRLITRSGVIVRRGHDMPLARISDIAYEFGPIDRMLGCGTLVIESAGERGQVRLSDVSRVKDMHRALGELLYGGDGVPESGR
jgi:membrane protein YdbS with pleckstrin-like domain